MEKNRNIPFKNYILLAVTLILTVIVVVYFFVWHSNNEENNLKIPIMDKYLRVINYNKEIREFEKKLKLIINDYSLNNTILYLDLTDKNIDKLKLEDKNINYPAVLIYKNGKIISYFDIKKNNYDIKLLKEYLIEEGIINND